MQNQFRLRVGILGAGLGSRLKTTAGAKPLAKLGAQTLLELLLGRFQEAGAQEISCALRAELLSPAMRESLPHLEGLRYLFVNTESSLHTLADLIRSLEPRGGPVLFTMADTIMLPDDFRQFLRFCASLGPKENAVLLSTFVDDEKPLWAHLDESGDVRSFGSSPAQHVTSGMYFLQPEAMLLALKLVKEGAEKMRNFLSQLAAQGFPVKSFVVQKTIDVDHPSDLEKASLFLRGQ